MAAQSYWLYIVKCNDGTLYTGITTDLKRRVDEHNSSHLGAKYTYARRPVQLVYKKAYESRSEASQAEAALKKLPRDAKLTLIREG